MADLSQANVGGIDYNLKDSTARSNANIALLELAYKEDGNTASQPYSVIGTPINWKGTLYYTKTAVASGATWQVGTNLTAAGNLGKLTSNIKTYVNSSGKLVFRDLTGADTVLPFSGKPTQLQSLTSPATVKVGDLLIYWGYGLYNHTINGATKLSETISGSQGINKTEIWQATSTTVTFTLGSAVADAVVRLY